MSKFIIKHSLFLLSSDVFFHYNDMPTLSCKTRVKPLGLSLLVTTMNPMFRGPGKHAVFDDGF